jgi:PQQ-like domain
MVWRMTWAHVYGNAANTSFADVATQPAVRDEWRASDLGRFAPGSGPVIGPDGTVYVGNTDGVLHAITPAGKLQWKRDTPQQRIGASPVVGLDGSIYVIGLSREGEPPNIRNDSTLYRFHSGGAMLWARPFPEGHPPNWGSGMTTASPNIWRSGNDEVIIVPHLYPTYGGHWVRLVAFSTTGGVLFNHKVTYVSYEITGSVDWTTFIPTINNLFGIGPTMLAPASHQLPYDATLGMPSVGMYTSGDGDPIVVVADNYENLVGYAFSLADGFQELFRKHLTHGAIHMSTPVVLRDAHSVIVGRSTDRAWLFFGGPSVVNWPEMPIPFSGAGPSVGADGLLVVARAGAVSSIATHPDRQVVTKTPPLEAESIAPAAASRTHVFVSTVEVLVTLDAAGLNIAPERFYWNDGGLSTPGIGTDGRVYALAGDTLFCFAGPTPDPGGHGPVIHDPIVHG